MAQATSGLVDYGATSEEDDFSDFESREVEGPGSPLACLRMSRWWSDAWLSPDDCPASGREQSDSELDQSPQVHAGPSPEVLTINSSTEEDAEAVHAGQASQPATCRREDQETHSRSDSGDGSDSDSSNSTSPRSPSPVLEHCSSDGEDQKPAKKRPRLQNSVRGAQGRGAYALKFQQLTPELQDLLARSRAFFTKPHSLQRPGGPVSSSTYSKAQERILCYLGFIEGRLRRQPTPAVLERADLIEEYLDFLRDERKLTPATLSNHASSLLYPLKYIHRASGPDYQQVPIVAQLRRASSQLQRQGEVSRPRTVEQLRALNRWLNW